jgi:hypothetical protein
MAAKRGRRAFSFTSPIVLATMRAATPSCRAVSSATPYHVVVPEFTQ